MKLTSTQARWRELELGHIYRMVKCAFNSAAPPAKLGTAAYTTAKDIDNALMVAEVVMTLRGFPGSGPGTLPHVLEQVRFAGRPFPDSISRPHACAWTFFVFRHRNEGWRPKGQKGKTENGRPRKLSDITIHGITDHLTKRITRKIKPNCIRNWKKRVRFRIDFKKVFNSFGTPLSNDAEERQWRKYVHRTINVRNRNPALT